MSKIVPEHNIGHKSLNVPVLSQFASNVNTLNSKIECVRTSSSKPTGDMESYYTEGIYSCSETPTSKGSTNHVTFLRTYKVIYLGYAVLDRRYTLPMLPWVIAEIKRHGSRNMEEIFIEVTDQSLKAVNCESNELVFQHKLQTISKFAQSSHDSSCFTYMTREVVNGPWAYHVFQANDENTVIELFTTIREATKEISTQTQALPVINTASGVLDSVINSCQQYEVLYLGKIKVSGKRAPPTFIDDAVEKFKIYEAEKAKNFCYTRRRHGSGASISSLPPNLNLDDNINGSGLDKLINCNNENASNSAIANLDVFNHISCDNYTEPFVQSPLSPMSIYHPDHMHKFHSLHQTSTTHDKDQFTNVQSVTKKYSKNFNSKNTLMPPSSLITHTQSLDSPGCADIVRDLRDSDQSVMLRDRVRSCSGDIPRTKQTSLPIFYNRTGSSGTTDLLRPRAYTSPNPSSSHQRNRTMLFLIGRLEICLIGMDKKQLLLSRTFNDIAHCSQGVKFLDHFGFISREITLTGADCYTGYIFRCQTEKVVDEIMSTLKQAFHQAHHSYQNLPIKNPQVPKIVVCDACPMHWFHMLCTDIEGLNAEEAHLTILRKLGTLADADKEEIMVKFQNSDFKDVQEQNEVLMILLREFCEQRQMKHCHLPHGSSNGKNDSAFKEKYSKLDSFRQKAKKSLSSSFETFLKLTNRDDGRETPNLTDNNAVNLKKCEVIISDDTDVFMKDPDTRSYREGSYNDERTSSEQLSPILTRPRSSTFSSPREKIGSKKSNQQHENTKKRPIINMLIKSGYQNDSSPSVETPTKGSWRQAIFHRVQTPVHDKKHVVHSVRHDDSGSSEDESKAQKRKSKEELRALWRKAIIEQILLIRMEKENKKLQANQDAASHKRMKLNYKEITPCLKTLAAKWEEILNNSNRQDMQIDKSTLADMVKSGVPRHKRGEIWQFLAEFNLNMWKSSANSDIDLSVPYDELLKQLTSHQHSILIDIGRTFPNHPFYSQSLGPGQLSLFNLLKAYSLLDKEVGYCQGLSFVAGILLLHMPEERAFSLMKYLMFNLGLRRQYKTDMVAFQIQMYQLSRLIHDNYRDLYDLLEKFDIAPTLYAAPWFLTLFASQFPVGFVSRLFDLIFLTGMDVLFKVSLLLLGNYKNEILACDSFESIMEFLKSVLPSLDVLQMEIVFNQVFSLDISRQLHAYEVEYHVLLEEMIHSPSKNSAELENLQISNKNLKAQNMELMEQLQVAYSRIHNLEASEASLKSSVSRLETRVACLEDEKEALVHSLRIMKKRLEKLEVARIEGEVLLEEEEDHTPPFGVVYALAGSEREEDERFRQLIKDFTSGKESKEDNISGDKNEVSQKADSNFIPNSA